MAIDGDTVVVGAYQDDDDGSSSGSAYVFVRSGSTWSQQQKLTASDAAAGDAFGWSVGIDVDTVVVGAYQDDDDGSASGSAYVFVRSGSTWSQEQKLTASDAAADDYFGISVGISGDTVLAGAPLGDDDGTDSGSAYVFVRSGTTWSQQQKLTASDAATVDVFGTSVAISGDSAAIGAYLDDDDGSASGSAYVFVRSGSTWTEQQKLTASDGAANDQFAAWVAIDGDTVLAGARLADLGEDAGVAYVFERSGTTWSQSQKLTADDPGINDQFGVSVGVSGDTAVAGSFFDDDNGADSGSAYVFVVSTPTPTPTAVATATPTPTAVPTATPVVPSLGLWGLIALGGLLAAAVAWRMRRTAAGSAS